MGKFSKHWTLWQRTVWMWTGRGHTDVDAVQAELRHMKFQQLERSLEMIELKHKLAAEEEKRDFIERWVAE